MASPDSLEARVRSGLLARLGVTWQPSETYLTGINHAVSGAISLLRSISGNSMMSLADASDLDLAVTCAWYLAENRRAEFMHDYLSELNWLRAREAIAHGTDD